MRFFNILIAMVLAGCWGNIRESSGECTSFEFNDLNKDVNKWKEETPFKNITQKFFDEHIQRMEDLKYADPRSLYNVCEINTDNLDGFVIAKLNGPDLEMYLIPRYGNKLFLLACHSVSVDESLVKKSRFVDGDKLEMITIHIFEEDNFYVKDSVVTHYSIGKQNVFKKIKSDSVRW